MNEAASSVEPEVKTRFATVYDETVIIWVRTNCDMRFINLTPKIAQWTCSSVRGRMNLLNQLELRKFIVI
jgi:hypothetical protein